ncbi:hypothetical protein C2845_PM15G01150 [Panicum miliaceum]|uniref:Ubiquitin-like protease family profile domain-containing protein n=1 Tax=Panicum miliaceum TaxID=4540 RepID=A0A3L6QC44_PANMI|nr:hypothetical protein C2845_PM15G01150 [Panicum miliaceum]
MTPVNVDDDRSIVAATPSSTCSYPDDSHWSNPEAKQQEGPGRRKVGTTSVTLGLGGRQSKRLVLHPGYGTAQSKNKTAEPPSIPAREGSGGCMPERQQGVTKRQREILESLANDARTDIGLEMDKRLLQIEHKFDQKIKAQNEELAKLKKDKRMEGGVSGIEDDIAEMQTDIMIIDAYVDISNVKNASASFISTLQARKLLTHNQRNDKNMKFRKLINDKCVRRHLVQGIQYCFDSFGTPVDLCGWKIVPYPNIPQQEDGYSCGAFMIKYILAWDGDKMSHNFTSEEAYFAKYPEEQCKDTQDEDDNGVEMVVSGTGNTSTPADSKIGGKGNKGGKGIPSTTAASTEGGTAPAKRKRGRPRKIHPPTPRTAASAVLAKFSTEAISSQAKRAHRTGDKRDIKFGPQLKSPWKNDY